jgi:DNA-binding response OmpR family regulator
MWETASGECGAAMDAAPRKSGILVADDEGWVRGVLDIAMRRQGFAVCLAANGHEALDLFRRRRETIDAILLDIRMPGLDGPQTLAALRELDPEVPCCFMSGDFGDYTEEELLQLGAAKIFAKPFHLDDVVQVFRALTSNADSCPAPV